MVSEILSNVYYLLRKRAGLNQSQFASVVDVGRTAVSKYESGTSQPNLKTQGKMLEAAGCSREELTEIFCEALSKFLQGQVAIVEGRNRYRPTTYLAKSLALVEEHEAELDPALARALHNKMHMYDLAGLIFDRSRADLREIYVDCKKQIEKERVGS